MKTLDEQYELGKDYVAEIHGDKEEGTFCKHQMCFAFCAGFDAGYNEALGDGKSENKLVAWLAAIKDLRKLGKKVGLFVTADISLTYGRSSLTIYTLDENDKLDERVFEGNEHSNSGTMFSMDTYIEKAREFIYNYAGESAERLAEKEKALTEQLKDTKKKLAKAKKLTNTEK